VASLVNTIDMEDCIIVDGNENIIHIDEEPTSIELSDEDIVHHVLECGGRVAEPKENYCGLKEAIVYNKGSEWFMSFCDSDIVVPPSYVHFHEQFLALEFIHEIVYARDWVGVFDSPFINILIILTWAFLAIFLHDEEKE